MRECWINVYGRFLGHRHETHLEAAIHHDRAGGKGFDYRLHVKLKPPGAPRRYCNDLERHAWENCTRDGRAYSRATTLDDMGDLL